MPSTLNPLVGPGMSAAVKQDRLHDGVDHLVVVRGQGYGDAEFLADLFGLAKDHAEDGAVDGIVFAVEHERANGAGGLAETVGSALALFVAGPGGPTSRIAPCRGRTVRSTLLRKVKFRTA